MSYSTRGTSGEVAEEHLIARTRSVGGAHVFKVTTCKLRDPDSGEGGGNPGGPADPHGLGVVPGFHNGFGGLAGANGTRTTYVHMLFGFHSSSVIVRNPHPGTSWCSLLING